MSKIRDMAKGQECQVRYLGICNHDSSTTVLAHVRIAGLTGYGQKAPDILGAFCCSSCHDVIDGRVRTELSKDAVKREFYEGVMRTQYFLLQKGLIKI